MAFAWDLRVNRITTALIGASKVSQIENYIETIKIWTFLKKS